MTKPSLEDRLRLFPAALAALSGKAETAVRAWALLAVGALAVAGVLALLLALARTPGLGELLPWGSDFFYKGLVTHVVFAFQIWFLAMLGVMTSVAATANARPWTAVLAALGAAALLVPTLAGRGEASLNNYVPVLDHPLFIAGLVVVALALAIDCARVLAAARAWFDDPFGFAVAMAAAGYLAALVCFGAAAWAIPSATDASLKYERLFWGGGHALQFVNTLLLVAGWQALCRNLTGQPVLPPALARVCAALIALGAVLAPLFYLRHDVLDLAGREGFTQLYWWVLPVPVLALGIGLAWNLVRARFDWRSPSALALISSLIVFALGGGAGFFLGAGDTRTPSHYHAVIAGVNLVLMGLFHVRVLPALGRPAKSRRMVRLQFYLFGGGQMLHALGFYLAGASGVARKTFGAAQGLAGTRELLAMSAVGLGGTIAVAGGVIFVIQTLACLLRRKEEHGS